MEPVKLMREMRALGHTQEEAIVAGTDLATAQSNMPFELRAELSVELGLLPIKLPDGWKSHGQCQATGCHVFRSRDGMTVAATTTRERDGDAWLHVSYSRRHRVPDWKDTTRVKHNFIGDHRKAIIILPPSAEHVNLHPNCLHLWCNVDRDPLPDLRNGGQI